MALYTMDHKTELNFALVTLHQPLQQCLCYVRHSVDSQAVGLRNIFPSTLCGCH